MTQEKFISGYGGFALSAAIAFLMGGVAFMLGGDYPGTASRGFFFPAPQCWNLLPWVSFLLEWGVLFLCAVMIIAIKKRFNFIPTLTKIPASLFIICAGACTSLSTRLCSSSFLALSAIASLWLLFSRYRKGSAAESLFLVGLIASAGSFFDYSFIALVPAYIAGAVILKVSGPREMLALVLGAATPWWIAGGLTFFSFTGLECRAFSSLSPLVSAADGIGGGYIFILYVTAIILFYLADLVPLSSAGISARNMNKEIAVPAFLTVILVFAGFPSSDVYGAPLALFASFMAGYFCASRRGVARPVWWICLVSSLSLFIVSVYV